MTDTPIQRRKCKTMTKRRRSHQICATWQVQKPPFISNFDKSISTTPIFVFFYRFCSCYLVPISRILLRSNVAKCEMLSLGEDQEKVWWFLCKNASKMKQEKFLTLENGEEVTHEGDTSAPIQPSANKRSKESKSNQKQLHCILKD